ncbi:hypothetical protein ACIBKY_52785 [Nonomuraea sp. NPDC050394]|uniref:hypothetical protein n=1 Tax=Nonomuraea sp. NPDC050394 TaxID=3364363 RepID=UPI00379E7BC8
MSWESSRQRHLLVHAVLADIAATGRPSVSGELAARVAAEFGDFDGLLREVQLRWYRAFDARLDALLEDWPPDIDAALTALWLDLSAAMPGARFLLDAHAGRPALAALDAHHRRTLHAATGVHAVRLPRPPPHRRRCRWFVARTSTA